MKRVNWDLHSLEKSGSHAFFFGWNINAPPQKKNPEPGLKDKEDEEKDFLLFAVRIQP